jgi:ppGpp synthetase/RelA/SpoT-type nucleotidyltranferase
MPFPIEIIPPAVARYRRERDRYVKLADRVAEICREDVCDQNAIRAQVTFRVKTEKSFEGKLRRFSSQVGRDYTNEEDIFQSVGDLAGVRISAYRQEDCERIVEKLKGVFCGRAGSQEIDIDHKDKKSNDNQNFYRAIHVQVALPEEQLIGFYDNVGDISCEIQVCTMIAHVWNEVEHDIGYKTDLGEPSHDEKFNLNQLGLLVRQGDSCISALMAAHDHRVTGQAKQQAINDPRKAFVDVHDFVSRMRDFAGNAMPNFAENSGQLFDFLTDIDATSPQKILDMLHDFDQTSDTDHLNQLNAKLINTGLSLDQTSSDLMLIAVLERKKEEAREALKGRAGRGKGRPTRLHRISARYLDQT